MLTALDLGAEDINSDDEYFEIVTAPTDVFKIKEALEGAGVKVENAQVDMIADTESELDEKQQETILKLVDKLEELDDVQNVYHNAVITISDEEE